MGDWRKLFDFDIGFLRDAAGFLDTGLDRLSVDTLLSSDPDAEGVLDRAEHLVGLGFAACQQYVSSTISLRPLSAGEALGLGPKHAGGSSVASLVHAAANYWKHSAEWTQPFRENARRTIAILKTTGVEVPSSYALSNLLHGLVGPKEPRFHSLVPLLIEWRDELNRRF